MTDRGRTITADQVKLLIREGEGLTVEFKERYTPRIDERTGMGIRKMKEAMVAAGLREPTFKPDGFFRAIFHRSPELALKKGAPGSEKRFGEKYGDGSEKSSEKILVFLRKRNTASAREIAKALGLTSRAVEKQIAALKAAGRLRRVGPAKGGHWDVVR